MKSLKYLFPILVIFLATSCRVELFDCLQEEGTVENRVVALSEISELDIEVPVNIVLTEGTTQLIEIRAHSNVIDELLKDSDVDGGKWTIDIDGCSDINELDIFMTLKTIKDISVDGVANIRTNGAFENIDKLEIEVDGVADIEMEVINLNVFDIDIDGVGIVKMEGNTNEQKIDISGTAEMDNVNLESATTDIEINGDGICNVWAVNNLKADLNGSGKICIKGDAERDIDISGAFDIENCN